jgi:hypothetical protein
MGDATIHRTFAALELNESSIISFANQWGPLTGSHERHEDEALPHTGKDEELKDDDEMFVDSEDFYTKFDKIEVWFEKIARMKALVSLWDLVRKRNEVGISELVEFEQIGNEEYCYSVRIRFKSAKTIRWSIDFRPREWPNFSVYFGRGGKIALAQRCILDLINESLWGQSSTGVAAREGSQEFALLFCPHNLEAVLWLSFVREIVGERTLKQCVFCKKHFEVPSDKDARRQRSDKQFCSSKCRAAAFRERREKSNEKGATEND